MAKTSIEWTSGPNGEEGYTFNPWLGCAKVHAGCTNCYAEVSQAVTMRKGGGIRWGEVWQGGQRVVVADSTWKHPFTWARKAAEAGQRRKVFCASLADVLDVPQDPPANPEWAMKLTALMHGVPMAKVEEAVAWGKARVEETRATLDAARERLWDTIRKTAVMDLDYPGLTATPRWERHVEPQAGLKAGAPGLDWLLLTKRPENWALVPEDVRPLVWLGTSVSDQKTADEMVPRLLNAHGFRYRFLSCEPMVGSVDLVKWLGWWRCPDCGTARDPDFDHWIGSDVFCRHCDNDTPLPVEGRHIDWVVFGFESGSKARPGNVDWIRHGLKQCKGAGVSTFVKQLGAQPLDRQETWSDWRTRGASFVNRVDGMGRIILADPKGGDPEEWPEHLRVRQWPNAPGDTP